MDTVAAALIGLGLGSGLFHLALRWPAAGRAPALAPALAWWALTDPAVRRQLVARHGRLWLQLGVEAAGAALAASLWRRVGLSWDLMRLGASCGFLLLVSVIDVLHRRVPNGLIYPALVGMLLLQAFASPSARLAAGLGGLLAFGLFYLTARLRPGELGGGDVKLAAVIGLAFGFPQMLWALLLGAGAGAAAAVLLLFGLRWTRQRQMPYAPFLCLGALAVLLVDPMLLRLP